MKHYVGIDLGTTNSAICTFDGQKTTVWKSPEMSDVTPSVIYIDKRGRRFYGRRAYDMAPLNEKNAASLFKRYLGTNMKFTLGGQEMTPEECSAEILKVLFGYLPAEIAMDPETATVITVPAAFNQMKKDATLDAARMAGIQKVTLMQEPVAAVMSVMRASPGDKTFVIYDLGGGTFDVSVTESIGSRVNLLAQGGREMCGGRDLDRQIFQKIAVPWIEANFRLPTDWQNDPQWKTFSRLTMYACEQAKIELSSITETEIRMDEMRLNSRDQDGEEMYLDIPLTQKDLNELLEDTVTETVGVIRETLAKVGLQEQDVGQLIFIGGPTKYPPLRARVLDELGIPAGVMVDQMTAVAEGASIYAESVDWSDQQHHRKQTRDEISSLENVTIRYEKRTSLGEAKIAFVVAKGAQSMTLEVTSADSGWSSGRLALKKNTVVKVPLPANGDNHFHIQIWDDHGRQMPFDQSHIVITKTMAVIGTIPASSPIALKVLDKVGGKPVPVYLVEENEPLPKKGEITLVAGQTVRGGSEDSLVFTLWEGSIVDPIEDNRYVGTYRITGSSLPDVTIRMGSEIICSYEMSDAGALRLGVSIPSIGVDMQEKNFYSRRDGQTILDDQSHMQFQIRNLKERVEQIYERMPDDAEVQKLSDKVADIEDSVNSTEDPEVLLKANNDLLDSMRSLSHIRSTHRRDIRQLDLDLILEKYNMVKQHASKAEQDAFQKNYDAAVRYINKDNGAFESNVDELEIRVSSLMWRDDELIMGMLAYMVDNPGLFTDQARYSQLRRSGQAALRSGRVDEARSVLQDLVRIAHFSDVGDAEKMMEKVNVIRK